MSKSEFGHKHSPDMLRAVLNNLVLKPKLKETARKLGVHPTSLFSWLAQSRAGKPEFAVSWMGIEAQFADHVNNARKLSIISLDHNARDLAINGHSEPKYHDGKPVYQRDPKLEAEALDPLNWQLMYGDRPITDTFARDENGALIPEMINHPPNPQLLVKMLASLAPDLYGDKLSIEHNHTGHVWVSGTDAARQITQQSAPSFSTAFALTQDTATRARPVNVLAVPAPAENAKDFDARFRRKLLREPVLFYDADGKLQPPLSDDVIVEGTLQYQAYVEAGIEVAAQSPDALRKEGYENAFLADAMVVTGQWSAAPANAESREDPPEMIADEHDHVADPVDARPCNPLREDLERRAAQGVQNPRGEGEPSDDTAEKTNEPKEPVPAPVARNAPRSLRERKPWLFKDGGAS